MVNKILFNVNCFRFFLILCDMLYYEIKKYLNVDIKYE